jgi:hypothetical protein
MIPYQCTLIGPRWNAIGSKPGNFSMRRVSLAV